MNLLGSIDLMSSILEAKTSDALHMSMASAAQKCGFTTYVAGVQLISADGQSSHHIISGYPVEWQRIYAERNYLWSDPTVVHCQKSLEPLIWTESAFRPHDGMALWEEARSFGLGHGISVAMHETTGAKTMLSLVRDKALDSNEEEQKRLVAAAKVLASCAHFVSVRIARDARLKDEAIPKLTPQETECIRWASKGKTRWEIGRILSIAETTVAFHVKNAMQKLGASNQPQAVAIAIRLGLIN